MTRGRILCGGKLADVEIKMSRSVFYHDDEVLSSAHKEHSFCHLPVGNCWKLAAANRRPLFARLVASSGTGGAHTCKHIIII